MADSTASTFDFSLIVPCYCEEGHLFTNVMALNRYLSHTVFSYEFIFVEDKSPDRTADELKRICDALTQKHVPCQTIFHEKNCGRGATTMDGMRLARGRVIGFLDIDLENTMDALLSMILRIDADECDVLVGRRAVINPMQHPLRFVLSHGYRWLARTMLGLPVSDSETGFKIFRRLSILPILPRLKDGQWFWDTEIVDQAARAGLRVCEHPVVFSRNPEKKSTVRVFHDSVTYIQRLLGYWMRPKNNQ